jgi:hypothetical protein
MSVELNSTLETEESADLETIPLQRAGRCFQQGGLHKYRHSACPEDRLSARAEWVMLL